ncbi:MAG: DUF3990 domain-containing protein [Oscillospiraceae bacterium]|nr:DUF3990 domain-containing protein [Oscillospiraceae bacterium]
MELKDGMLLFHGSYTEVKQIDLGMCLEGKDFGSGFYLTSSVLQARNFIRSSVVKAQRFGKIPKTRNSGFVSSFRYHADGLRVYRFEKTDRDWLWFIAQNRRPYLAKDLAGRLDPDAFSADVIIGKVANDKTNTTITAYLNGLYGDITSDRAVNFAIEELMPNRLEDQYCFLTQKAVDRLEFREAEKYAG